MQTQASIARLSDPWKQRQQQEEEEEEEHVAEHNNNVAEDKVQVEGKGLEATTTAEAGAIADKPKVQGESKHVCAPPVNQEASAATSESSSANGSEPVSSRSDTNRPQPAPSAESTEPTQQQQQQQQQQSAQPLPFQHSLLFDID